MLSEISNARAKVAKLVPGLSAGVTLIYRPCFFASRLQAPPPSVHPGISVLEAQDALSRQQKQSSRVEGAPPTYSEVIGHYYHPTSLTPSHNHRIVSSSQTPPSSFIHGLLRPPPPQQGSVDNRNARNTKEKSQKPQQL